ncbi:MAG: hypothetical protein HKN88_05545 [Gammaproteobacteria bacterium]|nr:hypothetical protein [Gammaproteobacteria bacterium]NNC97518.1 hypothetical protein [Gammaproteobacteria bacterium]NNM14234.1 hypothetical protein [Gammaproteobacteria bacterium]
MSTHQIRCCINKSFLEKAEQDIHHILVQQRLRYNQAWFGHPALLKVFKLLRWIGLIASAIGLVLILLLLLIGPDKAADTGYQFGLGVFFILTFVLFILFNKITIKVHAFNDKLAVGGSLRLAKRMLKKAFRVAPYQAEYEIKGDLISYYQGVDNSWKYRWHRRLKGIAIGTEKVSVFFKSKNSFAPKILVLHNSPNELIDVLDTLKIEYQAFSNQSA